MLDATETTVETKLRKRPWKVAVIGGFVLFLGVWFLSPTGALNRPVKLKRGEDGQLHVIDGETIGSEGTLKASVGVVKASSSRSSVSSTSNSDPGWFRAKSLVLINRSDHLLMKRVGQLLLTELNQRSQWESVLYLPYGYELTEEIPANDLYMTIDLASIKESGIVGRELDAKIVATIGTSLQGSHHSVHDSLSPPTVSVRTQVSLDHQSSLTGVESAGASYSLQGVKIAEELVTALNDQVDNLQEKYSSPPPEIDQLLAEYRPAPKLKFLGESQPVASTHGIMLHNDTLWTIGKVENVEAMFEKVSQELQETGWQEYSKQLEKHAPYLRMKNDSKWLEVFPQDRPIDGTMAERREEPSQWFVRYRERMSAAELQKIYGELFTREQPDVELLLSLERLASHEQREQLFKLLEGQPQTNARGWIRLASWYASKKQNKKLINALQHATVASLFVQNSDELKRKVKDLIKKEKLDEDQIFAIDASIFEESGIQSLTPEDPELIQKFEEGNPVAFYLPGDEASEWSYVAAVVSEVEQGDFRLSYYEGDHKSSRGSSSMCCISLDYPNTHRSYAGAFTVEMTIKKIGPKQFEANAKLLKKNKTPGKSEETGDAPDSKSISVHPQHWFQRIPFFERTQTVSTSSYI